MNGDAFETVAVTDSQPEAAVMLSFLHWHGVPAYGMGRHAGADWALVVALGGIPIRVPSALAAEASALLAEVASRPAAVRPRLIANPLVNAVLLVLHTLLGGAPPPPRTRSTFRAVQAREGI